MKNLNDVDFIQNSIEDVEEYTAESLTVFTISASTGTASSLEPPTITYSSITLLADVTRISAREVNESGGIYKPDDLVINHTGSISQDCMVAYSSGTYNLVDKPVTTTIDNVDVRYRSVVRRA